MTKATLTVAGCATLLWAGTALATSTPQQKCDSARITAWKVYQSCVDTVVAKDAKRVSFDEFAAFAKCRHAYFKKWPRFGYRFAAWLTGSTCVGDRFTDNGDGTVTDNLSGLVWEKKGNLGDVHDMGNSYSWSTGSPSLPYAEQENGTVFTTFLPTVNGGEGFAGSNGWRLPTLAELQTIVLDFPCRGTAGGGHCTCPSSPCVDPALDAANTNAANYWSATSYVPLPGFAWDVYFVPWGNVAYDSKTTSGYVRAVRGGW